MRAPRSGGSSENASRSRETPLRKAGSLCLPPSLNPFDMDIKLKICGITNLADARFCAAAGADYLGFVQYEGSPRHITPGDAAEIIAWMYGPKAVGVYVNASAEEINRTAEAAGFDLVQLHGVEPPEVCAAVERPVVKALHVAPGTTVDDLRRLMDRYAPHVEAFLLDTKHGDAWGA